MYFLTVISSSLAVGDPHAKVPFGKLKPENVIGLPPPLTLHHPSTLSQDQLELIYNHIASVKFVGKLQINDYMHIMS